MTRKEELQEVIDTMVETTNILPFSASDDCKRNHLLNQIVACLTDIAISLATICDKYNEEKENKK